MRCVKCGYKIYSDNYDTWRVEDNGKDGTYWASGIIFSGKCYDGPHQPEVKSDRFNSLYAKLSH